MKNVTFYTKDIYKRYNRYHFKSVLNPKSNWAKILLVIIITIYVVLLKESVLFFTFFLISDILFILLYFTDLLADFQTDNIYQKYPDFFDTRHEFSFNKDSFTINTKEFNQEIPYKTLLKVVETNEDLYLYTSKVSAFLITKSGFKKDQDKVINILKKQVTNYITKKERIWIKN